jgi:hypothetical protein
MAGAARIDREAEVNQMNTNSPAGAAGGKATLTDRYVHATTRNLPEDQRDDVGEELRGSIADRIDSVRASSGLNDEQAEYAAIEELGDPDRLAAGYSGKRLQLIGPELYPSYIRVLKAVLVSVVPVVAIVIAVIESIEGGSAGSVIGKSIGTAVNVALQIAFWVTLTFALVERGSTPGQMEESPGGEWTPDKLPDVPRGTHGSLGEMVSSLVGSPSSEQRSSGSSSAPPLMTTAIACRCWTRTCGPSGSPSSSCCCWRRWPSRS